MDIDSLYPTAVALLRENFGRMPEDTEASWRGGANSFPALHMICVTTSPSGLSKMKSEGKKLHYPKPGMLSFCGLDLTLDRSVPKDEIWLEVDGRVVEKITGVLPDEWVGAA